MLGVVLVPAATFFNHPLNFWQSEALKNKSSDMFCGVADKYHIYQQGGAMHLVIQQVSEQIHTRKNLFLRI